MEISSYKSKLASFYESHNRMPTYTEMLHLFGFKSKNAVARIVSKLVDAGLVEKDSLGRLIPTDSFSEVPMLGLVKAGFPAESLEVLETTINLNNFLIQKKDKTYLLEVDGDSMIDAHIADGDMVIAERAHDARDGEIVIAQVDGEFTMKYLRKSSGRIWLEPANPDFKPIYPKYDFKICAIIKGVIRKY